MKKVYGYEINLVNRVMRLARENQMLIHEEMSENVITRLFYIFSQKGGLKLCHSLHLF